jgi:hypothetical protein
VRDDGVGAEVSKAEIGPINALAYNAGVSVFGTPLEADDAAWTDGST